MILITCTLILSAAETPPHPAEAIDYEEHFVSLNDGTILDRQTRLMWAAKDNGSLIDWQAARAYCAAFRLGGHADWRLPTLQELETLFTPDRPNRKPPSGDCNGGYFINRLIHITCCCPWAAEEGGSRPAAFPFNLQERFWHHQTAAIGNRVLPVRNAE